MTSSNKRESGLDRDRHSSILEHDKLPEDHEVGSLRREDGIWDWDEHRATYDLAARRAMVLFRDLRSIAGIDAAIARGLFAVATSNDEDHFAIRTGQSQSDVYKWPTVPSAEESKDVVLVGAFLGARRRGEPILEPQDVPLAAKRALVIQRNVPVLISMVSEDGLVGQRFQLTREFFARLMAAGSMLDVRETDIELSRWVSLLTPSEVSARFKDLARMYDRLVHPGRFRAVLARLQRAYTWRRS